MEGHKMNIWSIKFSPDGSKLASGSFDETAKLWDVNLGKLLFDLAGHTQAVVALAFSPDGKELATTSDDKSIKFWNVNDGKEVRSIHYGPEHVQAVAYSPDGKRLITGGRDKAALGELFQNFLGNSKFNKGISLRLWELSSGKLLQNFAHHANDVNDVAFSKDGKWIAAGSNDNTVSIWEMTR